MQMQYKCVNESKLILPEADETGTMERRVTSRHTLQGRVEITALLHDSLDYLYSSLAWNSFMVSMLFEQGFTD